MKTIALADTSVGTLNAGTEIIMIYMKKELNHLLSNNMVYTFPTHTPIINFYEKKSSFANIINNADLKLISATNLLRMDLFNKSPLWNINLLNCSILKDSILVGVGKSGIGDKPNFYSKLIYNKILSKRFKHSVRDEHTKKILNSMGFEAINTGCVTIWGLTKDKCKQINKQKKENVVFALNSKSKAHEQDSKIVSLLQKHYKKIYFWPQTAGDLSYLQELNLPTNEIYILTNNVAKLSNLLNENNTDYVGMRLHGGIFCMHHNVRSIILAVDYRATDMQESYNLNVLSRYNTDAIEKKIISNFETDVNINLKAIEDWKAQFNNF